MIPFFGKSRSRIFLVNIEGLSVYKLVNGKLILFAKFSDEDTGYENFRNYLQDTPATPVTLLIDSIAEDFLVEKVPHVGPLDRKGFLQRKTEQHFRGIDYRSARILGRESAGRKDDKVLFSAITKNLSVDNWVRILLAVEIPVESITTPAYALCKIAEEHKLQTSEKILLVNWEASGIRHTFIVNNRMMFSRLTSLPQEDEDNLALEIIQSCNQSNDYLEGVGLIGFDDSMDVHVITPFMEDSDFDELPKNRNFSHIRHHRAQQFLHEEDYSGPRDSITAVLLCVDWGIRKGQLANIYGSPAARRYHELRAVRRVVYLATAAVLAIAAMMAAPIVFDAFERQGRIAQISQDMLQIQIQYDALTAEFPETPIPSETMELAVDHYELLGSQSRSPQQMLSLISAVVSRHPGVAINSVTWALRGVESEVGFTQSLLNDQTRVSFSLFGTLIGSSSIQNSDRRLRAFINDLEQIEGAGVNPILMPIERDPNSEVSALLDDQSFDADFALSINMES